MSLHAFNQRILAEDLVRVRRPDDRERYAAAQRQARIDPNPHQIDAVIFALRRLREGGCILADEVGLGKTIEAGLVIAQSRAEGAQRILLIVPKSLIGQWQGELLNLFGIQARENEATAVPGPSARHIAVPSRHRIPRWRISGAPPAPPGRRRPLAQSTAWPKMPGRRVAVACRQRIGAKAAGRISQRRLPEHSTWRPPTLVTCHRSLTGERHRNITGERVRRWA